MRRDTAPLMEYPQVQRTEILEGGTAMAQKWAWEEEKVITSVTALPGHRLRIMLRTGSVLELNMANRLNSTRYYPLRDEALMASVSTDGERLLFGKGVDHDVQFGIRLAVLMALNLPGHTVSGVDPFQTEPETGPAARRALGNKRERTDHKWGERTNQDDGDRE